MPGTFPKPIPVTAVPQVLQPGRQSVGNGRTVPVPSYVAHGAALAREQTNRQGNKVQDAARVAALQANNHPLLKSVLIPAIAFTANTPLSLQHNLGRPYNGAMLINFQSSFAQYAVIPQTPASLSAVTVTIETNVSVVADVLVY